MSKCAQELVDLIRDIVSIEVDRQDATVVCIVESINSDSSLNIYLPPDREMVVRNIINASKYAFNAGDYGILYKVQNKIGNAFIIAKVGPGKVENVQSLLKKIETLEQNPGVTSVEGSGGGGTVTGITAGAGLVGSPTTISTAGVISLGTPSDISDESLSEVVSTGHSHKIDDTIARTAETPRLRETLVDALLGGERKPYGHDGYECDNGSIHIDGYYEGQIDGGGW